jgi:excisionase family DNA binding protein
MTGPRSETSTQPDGRGFHTVKEAAHLLRLCEKQVRRLIAGGQLTAYRFGSAIRIREEDLDLYINKSRFKI